MTGEIKGPFLKGGTKERWWHRSGPRMQKTLERGGPLLTLRGRGPCLGPRSRRIVP